MKIEVRRVNVNGSAEPAGTNSKTSFSASFLRGLNVRVKEGLIHGMVAARRLEVSAYKGPGNVHSMLEITKLRVYGEEQGRADKRRKI